VIYDSSLAIYQHAVLLSSQNQNLFDYNAKSVFEEGF